ncbi:MAG: hypothetical protein GC185_09290 [Alphaproteobacteria bacterium]|nr:hypothetical protein [Alphaproteobacteria bacterium]
MKLPFTDKQKSLNKRLCKAATAGDVQKVEELLEQGAEINQPRTDGPLFSAAYAKDSPSHHAVIRLLLARGAEVDIRNSVNCTPLMGAANKGNPVCARLSLEAGADRNLVGRDRDALGWAMLSGSAETVVLMQRGLEEAETPAPEGEDEVTTRRALGDRTLEEIFNFRARERISLIRKGETGPVEALTRESFDRVADPSVIRAAYRQYVEKGGTLPESHVFPGLLQKSSLSPRGGQP